ncbi:MAG: hypothetical protein MUE40_19050 [Anaerolineae bacterium]|nr:hypothetical protein [Anaerolineae bacterium]
MYPRLWGICVLLGLLLTAAGAQDAPTSVYEGALRAATTARTDLGEPAGWSFELLGATTLSNLGCPLVAGAELGRSVTPYRVTLNFASGQYVVHVSTDGTLTQLCDAKFGTPAAATPAPRSGCELTAAADPAVRLAPDSAAAVINSGGVLTEGRVFAIGRSVQGDWYQVVTLNQAIGWVEAAQVTAGSGCTSLPVTALPDPDFDGGTCFVTPASAFSNVRQLPSTDAAVVGQIFEGAYWQVFVRNTAGDWYYINPGWIAARVVQTYGICEGLSTNNDLVGVGANFLNPQLTPTPAGTAVPGTIDNTVPTTTATMTATVATGPAGATPAAAGGIVTSPAQPTPAPAGDLPPALAQLTLAAAADFVAFSGDSTRLVTAAGQAAPVVQVWDISEGTAATAGDPLALGDSGAIRGFSAAGDTLAILADDSTLRLFDLATGTLRASVPDVSPSPLALSADGTLLLAVSCVAADCAQGRIDLRDGASGALLRAQPAHTGRPLGADFSGDGRRIVSWGEDGVQVWDTQSGAFIAR